MRFADSLDEITTAVYKTDSQNITANTWLCELERKLFSMNAGREGFVSVWVCVHIVLFLESWSAGVIYIIMLLSQL